MIQKFVKLTVDNFFNALRSGRCLKLAKEVNENIVKDYVSLDENDPFKIYQNWKNMRYMQLRRYLSNLKIITLKRKLGENLMKQNRFRRDI